MKKYNYSILYEKQQLNIKRLNKYLTYLEGWNGYGGLPFSPQVIFIATNVIRSLRYQPHVSPTGRGTIQFDYIKGEDSLEAEIYENEVLVLRTLNDEEVEFSTTVHQLPTIISDFYAS